MWTALNTTLSLDDAYDLAEIDDVSRSWRDAAQADLDEKPTAPNRAKRAR